MNLDFQVILKECTWLVVTWLTIQAIADIVIATCMCLLLRHQRTGFQKTNSCPYYRHTTRHGLFHHNAHQLTHTNDTPGET
ncbi:hypothetical protein BS47DRAFT_606552 [Hydnum rufescens UP504]|uniref:Uncharacterized protein n=1 Tax=Hydnum rufescens UP504 TaxID=1448309 RepID=A0A9P6B4I2_9AGAM|nr:hypothetical protein BS47DRAFT_606552 [Hydnum rufescens UP504]